MGGILKERGGCCQCPEDYWIRAWKGVSSRIHAHQEKIDKEQQARFPIWYEHHKHKEEYREYCDNQAIYLLSTIGKVISKTSVTLDPSQQGAKTRLFRRNLGPGLDQSIKNSPSRLTQILLL